jgi:hypothetical protein
MPQQLRSLPVIVLGIWAIALAGIVVVQVLAADRTPLTSPQSGAAANEKAARSPEVEVTLSGLLGSQTSAGGETQYTLTVGGNVLTLDAGPAWFYGDKHPLAPFVGKNVTVIGEQAQGGTTVDVRSVDGATIRGAGKPPWAGGWKRVGKDHPGWSQEKWDKYQAKLNDKKAKFGLDCWPPGWCKDAAGKPVTPNATEAPPGG